MDLTTRELSERVTAWRRRTIGIISLSTGLLVPWLALQGQHGNWYARAVKMEFRQSGEPVQP
jgi:hypothetical protein